MDYASYYWSSPLRQQYMRASAVANRNKPQVRIRIRLMLFVMIREKPLFYSMSSCMSANKFLLGNGWRRVSPRFPACVKLATRTCARRSRSHLISAENGSISGQGHGLLVSLPISISTSGWGKETIKKKEGEKAAILVTNSNNTETMMLSRTWMCQSYLIFFCWFFMRKGVEWNGHFRRW